MVESNKPIKQLIDQSISQSINQSVNQLEQSRESNQDNQESNPQESKPIGLYYVLHLVFPWPFWGIQSPLALLMILTLDVVGEIRGKQNATQRSAFESVSGAHKYPEQFYASGKLP